MIILNTPGKFGYEFYKTRSNNSLSHGYHLYFTPIHNVWEERVVKKLLLVNSKKCFCLFL